MGCLCLASPLSLPAAPSAFLPLPLPFCFEACPCLAGRLAPPLRRRRRRRLLASPSAWVLAPLRPLLDLAPPLPPLPVSTAAATAGFFGGPNTLLTSARKMLVSTGLGLGSGSACCTVEGRGFWALRRSLLVIAATAAFLLVLVCSR